jgi:2-methylcitrate dehydratase PrpD
MNTAVKPYPSCRYGHAGIGAALALRAVNDIKPPEITAIRLELPRSGMTLIGAPAEKKPPRRTSSTASSAGRS